MQAGRPEDDGETARGLLHVPASATPQQVEAAYLQRLAELRMAFLDLGGFPRDPEQLALRFDNFVVGPSNAQAYELALRVAAHPSATCNPLFIRGRSGLGKTHLLQAIANAAGGRRRLALCCSAHNFVDEMIGSVARNRLQEFREKYRHLDYLLMDDVQMLGGRSRVQEETYALFNELVASGSQVVLAGRDMDALGNLGPGLRSRVAQSVAVEIRYPELPEREEIVFRKAEGLGCDMSRAIAYVLARQHATDVRELEAAVKRLHQYRSWGEQVCTPQQVETLLYGLLPRPGTGAAPSIGDIQEVVSRHFNLPMKDLVSGRGSLRVKRARQIALYLSRELCQATPDDLRRIWHAEPCQVTYAQKKIKGSLADPLLTEDLRSIRAALETLHVEA